MPNHLLPPFARTGWSTALWWPRRWAEPGFESRGGSLHSYGYIGKHHPGYEVDDCD